MNIIVLGAGGLGSVVGALLSKNHDVTLVGRKAHVHSINKSGLEIEKTFAGNYKVKADEKITDILPKTLIILATKITANKALMKEIMRLKSVINNRKAIIQK